ncbi:uncharacterized protein At4g15970-like [Salvia hispanica]|uniref:uncharacterized protein At4g15970-like n=1 Tax=Salvia hispanica TaxID=49212 RepID=UPI002009BBD3|nr:uncharacterized protein At4g15970-like [Salvia hispanica]
MQPSATRGGGVDGSTAKGGSDSLESGSYHRDTNHKPMLSGMAIKVTLMLVVVGTTFLILNQSSYPLEFFRNHSSFSRPSCENSNAGSSSVHQYTLQIPPSSPAEDENVELEKTLRSAAMKDNKTVIITTLNAAWAEPNSLFDLFLESFRIGDGTAHLLDHVVVGAFDKTAYERCKAEGLHCYIVRTEGVDFSGEAHFMSEDYLKMMWRRIDFLRNVLELGFDFVFTDADVMWLRDPFKKFYKDGDFQIACDHYVANYTDVSNSPNGGFNYVKSNNRTIEFYKFWHNGREYFPGRHDQDVLNMIKDNPIIPRIGLEFRFLDTAHFGGFCEPSEDLDEVITMHANCCIGIENKMHDLTMLINDWKRYMALPPSDRNSTTKSWTVPRICF